MKTVEAWIPDMGLDLSAAIIATRPTRDEALEAGNIYCNGAIKVTFEYVDAQTVDENQLTLAGIE